MPVDEEARNAARAYGQSSLSYSTLDPRLKRFTLPDKVGYVAYARTRKTLVALTGPVCADGDVGEFIDGFKALGEDEGLRTAFFGVGEGNAEAYQERGYHRLQVARDSVLDLGSFTTQGNRMENVRRGYNRAKNEGLQAEEYRPLEERDHLLEEECHVISNEWLHSRGTPELEFVIGRLDWDEPGDRRFFVARSERGLEAFLVMHPVYAKQGWYLDMSRRRSSSPNGTIDFLQVNAIETLKNEGARLLYLGMIPHIDAADELKGVGGVQKWALRFIARHFDFFYPASSETFFKDKYRPAWEPLYMYTSAPATFGLFHDIFKLFLPGGTLGILKWKLGRKR